MTGLFYPQHLLYVRAAEFSFEDSLKQGHLSAAIDFGSLCLSSYKKYGGHTWRNVAVYEYKLAMAMAKAGRTDDAAAHFAEARAILVGTHGREHRLVESIDKVGKDILNTCTNF